MILGLRGYLPVCVEMFNWHTGIRGCYWAVARAVAKFPAIYRMSHRRKSYVSCCGLKVKCLLGAHVMKHLIPSWYRSLKTVEPLGVGDLIEEVHYWGWAWRFYSLSKLLFPLYFLSMVAAKMIFFSVK